MVSSANKQFFYCVDLVCRYLRILLIHAVLAACITNSYAKKGKSVVFVSVMDLLSHLKSTFSVPYETERTLNALKYAKCLVLDDLGAESISSWGRDEVLAQLKAQAESDAAKNAKEENK